MIDIAEVVREYIGTMLWLEHCNGTVPTDDGHEHTTDNPQDCDASLDYIGYDADALAPEALKEIESDVTDFVEANAADLDGLTAAHIGHNFLLSRNGHGTGFWDRGWGERGDRLHDAASVYGTMGAYVGDDGQVWVHG